MHISQNSCSNSECDFSSVFSALCYSFESNAPCWRTHSLKYQTERTNEHIITYNERVSKRAVSESLVVRQLRTESKADLVCLLMNCWNYLAVSATDQMDRVVTRLLLLQLLLCAVHTWWRRRWWRLQRWRCAKNTLLVLVSCYFVVN